MSIFFVRLLGWNSLSSLFIRYSAPIFTIGNPRAAQMPAIINNKTGLGRMKYAMQENAGIKNAIK